MSKINNIYIWISIYESIIFDGFLILYGVDIDEENTEKNEIGKIQIKTNDILSFNKIKINEEYNKLPLRFNEANLVKFLDQFPNYQNVPRRLFRLDF